MNKFIYTIALLVVLSSCNNKKNPSNGNTDSSESINEGEPSQEVPAEFKKGADLIAANDCLACHKINEKLIGPSYQEVAAKYTTQDTDALVESIIKGGTGKWGEVPMIAHTNLSIDDAKEMVKYILSLK